MPQVTVYIREEDLPKWKAVEKKSEFISRALNERVGETRPHTVPKLPNQPVKVPPVNGFPCCQSKKRCKHWQWDSGEENWINTLTGELK